MLISRRGTSATSQAEQLVRSNLRRAACAAHLLRRALEQRNLNRALAQSNLHRASQSTCANHLRRASCTTRLRSAQGNLRRALAQSNAEQLSTPRGTCAEHAEQLGQSNLRRALAQRTCAEQPAQGNWRAATCAEPARSNLQACAENSQEHTCVRKRTREINITILLCSAH